MILQLLTMALATMVYAESDLKELSRNTCGMLSRWTPTSNVSGSLSYISQGMSNILSLDTNCESRLESALSSCFIDSEKSCTSLILSVDLLGHTDQSSITKFKRSPTGQNIADCPCKDSSISSDDIPTTITGTLTSAQPSASTYTTGSVSSTTDAVSSTTDAVSSTTDAVSSTTDAVSSTTDAVSSTTDTVNPSISSTTTIPSSAQPLQSPKTTAISSSASEPVCIIKFEDLNLKPPGKCYCSDGTKAEWKTGKCDVYP